MTNLPVWHWTAPTGATVLRRDRSRQPGGITDNTRRCGAYLRRAGGLLKISRGPGRSLVLQRLDPSPYVARVLLQDIQEPCVSVQIDAHRAKVSSHRRNTCFDPGELDLDALENFRDGVVCHVGNYSTVGCSVVASYLPRGLWVVHPRRSSVTTARGK